MKAPTLKQLQRRTREPFFAVDQAWLNDAFSTDRAREALIRWQASRVKSDPGLWMASRQGHVLFWEACRLRFQGGNFDPALYAALTASVWTEGKREHGCRELGVCEPEEMVAAMAPYALSPVLMTDADLEAYAALPETVTVYRGGTGPEDVLAKGTSWALERSVAEWFAEHRPEGVVIERQVRKDSLVALFTDRSECEAVIAT